jgi:hypothetical protein
VNPTCLTSLDLQVERIGGPKGTLVVFGIFCMLSLFLWISIIVRSKYIRIARED